MKEFRIFPFIIRTKAEYVQPTVWDFLIGAALISLGLFCIAIGAYFVGAIIIIAAFIKVNLSFGKGK